MIVMGEVTIVVVEAGEYVMGGSTDSELVEASTLRFDGSAVPHTDAVMGVVMMIVCFDSDLLKS